MMESKLIPYSFSDQIHYAYLEQWGFPLRIKTTDNDLTAELLKLFPLWF